MSFTDIRERAFYFGMSVSEFSSSTPCEVLTYVKARAEYEKKNSENLWKIMRYQSALIMTMLSSGKTIQPDDIFTFEDEPGKVHIDINSEEAKTVFEEMDTLIKKKMEKYG